YEAGGPEPAARRSRPSSSSSVARANAPGTRANRGYRRTRWIPRKEACLGSGRLARDASRVWLVEHHVGTEVEPIEAFELESGSLDRGRGVPVGVASCPEERPNRLDPVLPASESRRSRSHVFQEQETPARSQDPADLREG